MSEAARAPAPAVPGAASRRDRRVVALALGAITLLAWSWLAPAALDMYGDMSGLAAWMMAPAWDARYAALVFAMWSVMMVAMMLPSAAPAILLFDRVVRSAAAPRAPLARTAAFAGGYLLVWVAFSLLATLLQWLLWRGALLDPMMQARTPLLGGALLVVAGLYQWTALKRACLAHCRGPMETLARHWRPGVAGALRSGLIHGAFCLGCCWGLMLLLFTGGVMNLAWIGAISLFVLLEKLAPRGVQGGRLSGALLVGVGAWMAVRAIF